MASLPDRTVLLDGGFGMLLADEHPELEMADGLWGSGLAARSPQVIKDIHRQYLDAGADIITTATYQGFEDGYRTAGLAETSADVARVFADTIVLAVEARDEYAQAHGRQAMVAVSLGSIGATLGDLSEYTGDFTKRISADAIEAFHSRRFEQIALALGTDRLKGKAEFIAVETIPSLIEARAIVSALDRINASGPRLPPAWVSFCGSKPDCIGSGETIEEAVRVVDGSPSVFAVGANCIPMEVATKLVARMKTVTNKPILCYPNGQIWDGSPAYSEPAHKHLPESFAAEAKKWAQAGARIIGGCCKTTPKHICGLERAFGI
ncbi:Homocysteine S-methyltransferase [Linderina pennispora]|uniref:Homocysteine S-methyltransferase n=1 Tax=Linderina pennispora TaxID=61395 RepID=A0A1Y1W343_9FUNG|nr:Homocysteine S-methyltransferase [Linderina pennispora]ORX67574.1 Homocysteine S-methyltransferase [Linderina pennispora]